MHKIHRIISCLSCTSLLSFELSQFSAKHSRESEKRRRE